MKKGNRRRRFPLLKSRAILAPMSGVTDTAFRALCRRYKAGLAYTEFVSSAAVVRGNKRTSSLLRTDSIEKPAAVQLFSHSEKEAVEAAKILEKKFDIIDINCGCPVHKVIKTGAGSAMLNSPEKICRLIKRIVAAVDVPLTVKIRTGITENNINAAEVARAAEEAGAAAITVHGRTQKQGYSGKADWGIIRKVKRAVAITVIGNGDISTPEGFKEKMEYSGVDYIMIGRGAVGNPYIFTQIYDYLTKGRYDKTSRISHFSEYLKLAKKHSIGLEAIKSHAMQFTKGVVGGAAIRDKISKCRYAREIEELLLKIHE